MVARTSQNSPQRPIPLRVMFENIPEQLQALPQWVMWRYELKKNKWTKVPYSPNGSKASSTNARTWSQYRDVVSAYLDGNWDGIGITLPKGGELFGIDLDKCSIDAAAPFLVDTYTEQSPSGTGFRQIGIGRKTNGAGCKVNRPCPGVEAVEIYDSGRYLTITGNRLEDRPYDVKPCQSALDAVCAKLWPQEGGSDGALVDAIRRGRQGPKFTALYDHGDLSHHNGDASAADLALVGILAANTSDRAQIDRVFRASALYRPKWDERHRSDGATYGQMTIEQAWQPQKLPSPTKLVPVDLSDVMTSKPKSPQFIIKPWLPRRLVALLGAHGGLGKTYLALVIAAHVASGTRLFGLDVEQARVVFTSLEDEPELIRYRLRLIIEEYELNPFRVLENITLLDGTSGYAALLTEGMNTASPVLLTAAYTSLAEQSMGAGLVIVDNASDAFDANENQRRHVRGFIRALTDIARDNDAAVLLLAHIDKNAARNGSQGNSYSGSTAWHNSCRSRLAVLNQDGLVTIEHEKNNLGPKAEAVVISFTDKGVPVPEKRKTAPDGTLVEHLDQREMIRVFQAAHQADINVPANLNPGANSAFTVLATLPEYSRFAKGKQSRELAARTIVALKRAGTIVEEDYRKPNRHHASRLVLAKSAPTLPAAGRNQEAATP